MPLVDRLWSSFVVCCRLGSRIILLWPSVSVSVVSLAVRMNIFYA